MKKVILSVCFVVAMAGFASAQQGGGQGGMTPERMAQMKQKMKDELQLTDVQADSVMAIQRTFMPKTRDLRMDQTMSDTDKQTKMAVINDERNKRLETSLGKDVAQKVEDYYTKMRQNGGGQRP